MRGLFLIGYLLIPLILLCYSVTRSTWRIKIRSSMASILILAILFCFLPINKVEVAEAATHTHTSACYAGEKHVHTGTSTRYGGCYKGSYIQGEFIPCGGSWDFVRGQYLSPAGGCPECGSEAVYICMDYVCTACGSGYTVSNGPYCTSCDWSNPYSDSYGYAEGLPTCGYYTSGYYETSCGKNTSNYYDSNGNVCSSICSQVVTSLFPVSPTQTINVGQSPDFRANVTYLDGSTAQVTCTASGYSATTYNTPQTVTLSYGQYKGNAQTPGATTATITVTVNGKFALNVSSSDTTMGSVSGGSSEVLAGTSTTIKATPNTGYSFVNWVDTSTGSQVSTSVSYTFNMPSKAVNYKAVFKANSYNVQFNSNGGTACSPKSVTYNTAYGTLPSTTRSGYSFIRWTLNGSEVTASTTMKTAGTHTLVANWSANSYTVSFNSNGGSACDGKNVVYDSAYGSLPTPTRAGYTFTKWTLNGSEVNSSTTVKTAGNHTLVANWSANTSALSFNSNGGSACNNQNVVYDSAYGALPTPSRAGYTFQGWYLGSTKITSSSVCKTVGAHTLTASWSANSYSLSYNSNGGSACAGKNVTYDSSYGDLPSPTRAGYTFAGWYLNGVRIISSSTVKTAGAHTLTASWSANSYTVSFDSKGGSTCSNKGVVYASAYGTLPSPTRTGYDFSGWYIGSTRIVNTTTVSTVGNHTLTASWTAKTGSVTFDSAGGSSCGSISTTYDSAYGSLPTPTRAGYTFKGWYLGSTDIISSSICKTVGTHTLTAKWSANTYKITILDFNGTKTKELSFVCDTTATVDAGIKPASWFTTWTVISGNVSGIDVNEDTTSFNMPPNDLILRANWNDVVSIRSEFNSALYSGYTGAYDSAKNSFNLDAISSKSVEVTKGMLNVWVVFEDGSTKRVTDVSDFDIWDNVISTIGSANVQIGLKNIKRADGTAFTCYNTIYTHSASLSNIMRELGITTYEDLANYIADIRGKLQRAVSVIKEYEDALYDYKDLLNQAGGNNIQLDSDVTANIGRIEVGIRNVLGEIDDYQSKLVAIQNAIVDAGGDLGSDFNIHDGDFSTIMSQISRLKIEIGNIRDECNTLNTFCDDLRSLLGLESGSSLQDIYDAVDDIKNKLENAEGRLANASDITDKIGADISEDYDNTAPLLDKLDYAANEVKSIKIDLSLVNKEILGLISKTELIINGDSDIDLVYDATTIKEELCDLTSYLNEVSTNADTTLGIISALKDLLGIAQDATLQDIYDKTAELKATLEATELELSDTRNKLEIAEKKLSDASDKNDEIDLDISGEFDSDLPLLDKLDHTATEVKGIKTNLSVINKELLVLLSKTDSILNGETDTDLAYDVTHIKAELQDLTSFVDDISMNADETLGIISSLKDLLNLSQDSSLQDVYDAVAELKGRMESADAELAEVSSIVDKLGTDIFEDYDSAEILVDRLLTSSGEVTAIKNTLATINERLLDLHAKTETIINGSYDIEAKYDATNIQVELKDLDTYLIAIVKDADKTMSEINKLKELIGLSDNASLQEIYDKVAEFKSRMELAEYQVSQYEKTLESLYDKMGVDADNQAELEVYLEECLSGLNDLSFDVYLIDEEVESMIVDIKTRVDGDGTVPVVSGSAIAVSGSALSVKVEDLDRDVKTLRDYVDMVLAFADEVADLFGITPSEGSLTLEEVMDGLTTIKSEYDMYIEMIQRLETLIASGDIDENDLSEQLSALYARIEALKRQLDSTDSMLSAEFGDGKSIQEIKESIQGLKQALSDALRYITELQNDNLSKDLLIRDKDSRIAELEALLAERNAEISSLKEDLTSKRLRISSLERKLASRDETINNLKIQLENERKITSDRGIEVNRLTSKVSDLESQLKEMTSYADKKDTEVEKLEKKLSLNVDKLNDKDDEISSLKGSLSSKETEIADLISRVNALRKDLNESRSELSSLSKLLDDEPGTDFSNEIKELQSQLTARDVKIKDLQEQIVTKNNKIETLNNRIISLKDGVDTTPPTDSEQISKSEELIALQEKADAYDKASVDLKVSEKELKELELRNKDLNLQVEDAKNRYRELVFEVTRLKNIDRVPNIGDSSYTVDSANRYSGIYLSNDVDMLNKIEDDVTGGYRVVHVDSWDTSDGMLLCEDNYMLSFFEDYAWTNSLDIMQNENSNQPSVLNDVMLYQINMNTGEFVTFVISEVNYNP